MGAASSSTAVTLQLAEGLTAADMNDAYPSRDPVNVQNWYGTSLFGWNGCDARNLAWKGNIKEAYKDANKLVNYDGIVKDLDFNSAAALEFLGPSGLNKGEQNQIQDVLANVATVYEGSSWYTPNWIRARCDDPMRYCTQPKDPPECPSPSTAANEDTSVVFAYVRNPFSQGNDKFSEINFCPQFFDLRNLDNAIAYGSAPSHPILRSRLDDYQGRADAFLHELFHLDLAANSKNDKPNPQIRDLSIKYTEGSGINKGTKHSWTKVYGPRLSKILARFQPVRRDTTLGYWIQRSDDSYTMFALASYVVKQLGFYPYLPICYDQINDMPLLPPGQSNGLNEYDVVSYSTSDVGNSQFINFTSSDEGKCPAVNDSGLDEDVEIGEANPITLYSDIYRIQHSQWIQNIMNYTNRANTGTCRLTITEIWTSGPDESNLYANIVIHDSSGSLLYSTPGSTQMPGVPISDASPFHVKETSMKEELIIVGEHAKDYMQFSYGDQRWQSSTTDGMPSCTLQGNDWKPPASEEASTRTFDCRYIC